MELKDPYLRDLLLNDNGLEFAGLNDLTFAGLQDLQFVKYKFGRLDQTSSTVVDREFVLSYNMIFPTITFDDADD